MSLSPPPRRRSSSTTAGKSVRCAPERIESPTASTSSWIAASATISGVRSDELVATAPPPELLDHGREERQVRPGEDREPDRVDVLLDRRLGDHLRRPI